MQYTCNLVHGLCGLGFFNQPQLGSLCFQDLIIKKWQPSIY